MDQLYHNQFFWKQETYILHMRDLLPAYLTEESYSVII